MFFSCALLGDIVKLIFDNQEGGQSMLKRILGTILLSGALVVAGCGSSAVETSGEITSPEVKIESMESNSSSTNSVNAKLHFIDTGQSDCILIESDGEFMLIDGGDRDDDATVKAYLEQAGVKELKYVVATHFHADHLGALDTVVRDFNVASVFVPNGDADTAVYRDFINSCIERNLRPSVPLDDVIFELGNSTFRVLNVKGGYSNINNNSLVVELTSGKTKALFTGDIEAEAELAILEDLAQVDILKVAHHGSSSSSTDEFLDKVNPEVAIIQTELGNSYGHPHRETVAALERRQIEVHRNDECGDIIYSIDENGYYTACTTIGSYINGNQKAGETNPPTTAPNNKEGIVNNIPQDTIVYWTPNGGKYHKTAACSGLSNSKTILEGTMEESKKEGPCKICY